MIVLFDTCVVLDYLMDREPFSNDAYELIKMLVSNRFEGFISVKSVMDIHYIVKKQLNDEPKTRNIIKDLSSIFEIVDSTTYCCLKALNSKIKDYEDALMSETGELMSADFFVTRNIKDYNKSGLSVITPKALIKLLNKENN